MIRRIKAATQEVFPTIAQLRRTIHRNPELASKEFETARLIRDTLTQVGLPVRSGIAKTGLVAILQGAQPGPTVLLRADMDALPIHEETGVPFASSRPGVMHACGHDVHTASLLGAAMVLNRIREHVRGKVQMVFQPSEELLPGGAKPMIDSGILVEDTMPHAAFAQHVQPMFPAGVIGVRSGMFMASSDELHIRIEGQGGHAAESHTLAGDAVMAAAHVIVALQSVISRHRPPDAPSVLSIGKVSAPGATNVIPSTALMEGTFRTMQEQWRTRAHTLIHQKVKHIAAAHGTVATVNIVSGYPALYNDPEAAALTRASAIDYVGASNTVDADLWFASEDFAYFLQAMPGTLYLLGAGCPHAIHTSRFLADDTALLTGTGFMAYLAWRFLASSS